MQPISGLVSGSPLSLGARCYSKPLAARPPNTPRCLKYSPACRLLQRPAVLTPQTVPCPDSDLVAVVKPTMETLTTLAPSDISIDPLDTMDSATSPDFLKMEDLDSNTPPSDDTSRTYDTPEPVIIRSQAAKKRKSWGQTLPEPKTTLPPRKRAKTDDEKEQRRIERIKRNRAAAHNSRERKRQEAEVLAVLLAKAEAKLKAYEKLHGPLPSHIVLPEVITVPEDRYVPCGGPLVIHMLTLLSSATTPAPSLVESRGSVDATTSPATPGLFDSSSNVDIKQEPQDSPFSHYTHSFDNLDNKPQMPTLPLLDQTQHSAEMLCTSDLPCQSSSSRVSRACSTTTPSWWATLMLHLLNIQITTTYKTLLLGLWMTSPSRVTARMTQALTRASTSSLATGSTRMAWMPRSPRAMALAQHNAATVLARLALQRSLVGTDRQGRSLAAASQQGCAAGGHSMALEGRRQQQQQHRNGRHGDDVNDGVGRTGGPPS